MSELEKIKQNLQTMISEVDKIEEKIKSSSNEKINFGNIVINVPKMFMSIKEAAKVTGIGEATLKKWTYKRGFPHYKSGTKILINMAKINEWVYENQDAI